MEPLSENTSTIAFYCAMSAKIALVPVLDLCEGWLLDLSPPTHLGLDGKGFSGKPGTYKRMRTQLRKKGDEHLEGFTVSCAPQWAEAPCAQWKHLFSVLPPIRTKSGSMDRPLICIINSETEESGFSKARFAPLFPELMAMLKPVYGFGYFMERLRGPGFDVLGMGVAGGRITAEQRKRRELDGKERRRWRMYGMDLQYIEKGLLRDIFPWNFLSAVHLDLKVRGATLRDWIEAAPAHGALKLLAGETYLWDIEESHINFIREELTGQGLFLSDLPEI